MFSLYYDISRYIVISNVFDNNYCEKKKNYERIKMSLDLIDRDLDHKSWILVHDDFLYVIVF